LSQMKSDELKTSASPNTLGKASVIDLGSNSVKMVNYNVDSKNFYKPYHQESVRVKLAEGLQDGIIKESYIEDAVEILKYFRNVADFEQIDYIISVATSAVRDASNQEYFVEKIQKETGFNFKILSEYEEALYSYAGAIRLLNLPHVVFFDIGGGSLEIVSSYNFEIQKVISLPLGSLRLTQKFSSPGGISSKQLRKLKEHVTELLPDRGELGISDFNDAVLVGVGGSLRALGKHAQERISYPLKKLHNYKISLESFDSLSDELLLQDTEEIARIDSIGASRADTIKAGTIVIAELMKKSKFHSLTISAQGLREGTLWLSLQYPDEFSHHQITAEHVQELVHLSCQPGLISEYVEELIGLLFSMKLISDKERILLAHAILQIDKLSSFRDVDNVLYTILDDDSILSHREQIIVALSLIYSKKKKKAEHLLTKFKDVLEPSDKKIIKKISTVVSLCDIFHKTGTLVKPKMDSDNLLVLKVHVSKNTFPEVLLQQACTKMESILGIHIDSTIYYRTSGHTPSEPMGVSHATETLENL